MLKKIDASNKNMKETTLKFFGSFVKELKEFKYINLLLLYKIKEWKVIKILEMIIKNKIITIFSILKRIFNLLELYNSFI